MAELPLETWGRSRRSVYTKWQWIRWFLLNQKIEEGYKLRLRD